MAAFNPFVTGTVSELPDGRFSYRYEIVNPTDSLHDIYEFALELADSVIVEVAETPVGWDVNAVPGLFDIVWSTEFDYLAPGENGSFRLVSVLPPGSVRTAVTGLHFLDPELDESVEAYYVGPVAYQGDYDVDFDVDGADFLIWQRQYGSIAASSFFGADGNGDGIVNAADYTVWRDNYGHVGTQALAAVPEPASAGLAFLGVASFLGLNRRRRASFSVAV